MEEDGKLFQSRPFDFFNEANNDFHTHIVAASHNEYLVNVYEQLHNNILRYRYFMRFKWGEETILNKLKNPRWHKTICNAIKDGYSTVARDEMINHIEELKHLAFIK